MRDCEVEQAFDKLLSQDNSQDLLPDLLRNYHMENPALLLVKDVKDNDLGETEDGIR